VSDAVETGPQQRPGGRRVLFVDPPSVIEEQMIHFLVAAQYETAVVPDPRKIQPVLRKFPRSVVYFNIDTRLPPSALEQIVRGVKNTEAQHGAEIGILSYNNNQELAEKYLMELGITAGYITLHIGFEKSARIIIRALEAAQARGERKFVRVKVPTGKASLNINTGSSTVEGQILDISEAGAACILKTDYGVGTHFNDIQLRLWGNLARTSGTIRGERTSPQGKVSVIMFDQFSDSAARGKLYRFLRRVMQHEVEMLM
jgi:hypothetical protein